jgi:hypothetical protein
MNGKLAYLKDLFERVSATFVEGFVGTLLATWTGVIPADWRGWLTGAALTALAAAVKGLFAKTVGDRATASLAPSLLTRAASSVSPPRPGPVD